MKAATIKAVRFTLDKEEKETMAYAYDIIKKARDKVFTEHIDSEEEKFKTCLQLIRDITDGNEIGIIK